MFIPPLNMGQFQPSPATMSQWIYQIWQFLQENPIATETEIREFIQSELTQSETLGNAIEEYLTENPPQAPVQSVQGKTGAVTLNYPDIVPASNAVPVYKSASSPNASTAQGLYNNGYRLFVNTTTQEIFTISTAGALSLVGRGKFDGTTVDLNTAQGDTTIAEAIAENNTALTQKIDNKLGSILVSIGGVNVTTAEAGIYYGSLSIASQLPSGATPISIVVDGSLGVDIQFRLKTDKTILITAPASQTIASGKQIRVYYYRT